jgi:two-component system, NarL family, nitrate/nitrite response regulator NarL
MHNPQDTSHAEASIARKERAPSFLVVDDHPLMSAALASSLSVLYPGSPVRTASSLAKAFDALEREQLGIVLLDLLLTDSQGLTTLRTLVEWCQLNGQQPQILVLSAADDTDPNIINLVINEAGAGYLSKKMHPDEFKRAVRVTVEGGTYIPPEHVRSTTQPISSDVLRSLSERELTIARMFGTGLSAKAILKELATQGVDIAENTVRAHIQRAAWKLRIELRQKEPLPPRATIVTALAIARRQAPASDTTSDR